MMCKLCLKEGKLQNSHIIPEFFYKPLYDEKHRFHVLSNMKAKRNTRLQKGAREKLLCKDCENKFSFFERYVSHVFNGIKPIESEKKGVFVYFKGYDFNKLNKFALSILWRAGVSKLPFYSEV